MMLFGLVGRIGKPNVIRRGSGFLAVENSACSSLLKGMRQLMGQQPLSLLGVRSVLASRKYQVLTGCVGARIHRSGRSRCLKTGVHPHIAEVVAKARFHKCTRSRIERLARRAQYLMDDRGRDGWTCAGLTTMHLLLIFLFALRAFALQFVFFVVACGTASLHLYRGLHPHYLIRPAISFLLVYVSCAIDCKS